MSPLHGGRARGLTVQTGMRSHGDLEQALGGIPMPFVGILVMWLAVIFFSFGLFAHHHFGVVAVLLVVAASASVALFLILELTHPFEGLMRIPSEPLLKAVPPLFS